MYKYLLFTLVSVSFVLTKAQVVINEVSPSNISGLVDNYGDNPDWVELYNAGTTAINLQNYALSDDVFITDKWVFPSVVIEPEDYLVVYLSGRNTNDFIDHWESPVVESDIWSYIVPDESTSENWRSRSFDDSAWETGPGGIGYGDEDDSTVVDGPPLTSVFMRTAFDLTDTSLVQAGVFHMDFDDGFVAYLNGTEIARSNMTETDYDDTALSDREAKMYTGENPDEFELDIKTLRSLLVEGTNVLAIQVHNHSAESSDLSARPFLSFGIKSAETFWSSTPSFFTPSNGGVYLHANFSLSNGNEPIALFRPNGTPADGINPPTVLPDVSYGRQTDGASAFRMFSPSSPGASNSEGTAYLGITSDKITFSLPAGFYSGTQSLRLSTTNSNVTIRYTTDGSKPTPSSTVYSESISIPSTRVIRAAAFVDDKLTEFYETNTYLIGSEDDPELPVMSISGNPDDFFDFNTGIYELGPNASGVAPNHGANFWQDWEKEIHFEYFDENKQLGIEQDCGVKIFGGWSRDHPMKSLRIIGRDEYGDKNLEYKFFKSKNITSFRQLVLRNSGNDFNLTHFRDALNHEVVKDVGNHDLMAYQPVVVFINGEYFGVHNLRERMNHHYVEDNHGIDDDDINLIENSGPGEENAKRGDDVDWKNTVDFILNSDLSTTSNWNQVKEMIDVPNFIDFFVSQTYHINWDAPYNNARVWRPMDNSKPWRYMYYDTDFGLNLFGQSHTAPTYNELSRWINDDRSSHTLILKKLLTNEEFKCLFVNRYADLMNTVYSPSNYNGVVDSIRTLLYDDMGRHFDRWGSSYESWNGEINSVKSFIDDRRSNVRDHISSTISGADELGELLVNVEPAEAGKVMINTITPDNYSWSGSYYSGCPVELSVVPNIGYKFDDWSGANTSSNKTISLSMSSDRSVVANFSVDTNIPKITFSEINYNSPSEKNSGDWIELYNYGTSDTDLSGWKIKDGNDFNEFVIPNGTVLEKNQYLVISNDIVAFNAIHPSVTNVIGGISFKFSNSGETVRLFDEFDRLRLTVTYDNKSPWSKIADGKGGTLELINPELSLNDPTNWFGGCLGGSPGQQYVECPCEGPFLGDKAYLCENGGSVGLSSGLSQENRAFTWYFNGDKLPDTLTTITVSNEGTYNVLMQSLTCVKESSIEVGNNISFDLGEDFELCTPAERNLTIGAIYDNATYTWFRNATDLNINSGSLKVTSPGVYKLNAKLGSCATVTDQVTVTSLNPTPVDVKDCDGGSVTLSVQGTNQYKWYTTPTGGSSLETGNSYTTTLNETTTFYVENADATNANYFSAGPVDTTFGDTWGHDNFEGYRLRFEIFKTCYLNFVTVYPDGSNSITINITPDGGTTKTVTVPAQASGTTQRIYLGHRLTANKYTIDAIGTDGELIMNNENSAFPYTDGNGYISIYRTEPDWAEGQGWYFFFYNFELGDDLYVPVCDRTPVTAYLCEAPEATIFANANTIQTNESVEFSVVVEGDYYSLSWDFGVGASPRYVTGAGPHIISYTQRGAFNVSVTVVDDVDSYTYTYGQPITVCTKPTVASLTSDDDEYCNEPILMSANYLDGYRYIWKKDGETIASVVNGNTREALDFGFYNVTIADPVNLTLCGTTSNEIEIKDCVLGSVSSLDLANRQIELYPNPVTNRVFVTGVEGAVKIQDLRGVVLLEQDTTINGINVESLNQGVYILTVKDNLGEYSIRLIKE